MHVVVDVQVFLVVEHHVDHAVTVHVHEVDQRNVRIRIRLLGRLNQKFVGVLQTKHLLTPVNFLDVDFIVVLVDCFAKNVLL